MKAGYRHIVLYILAAVLSMPALAADTTGVTKDSIKIGIFGPAARTAGVWAKQLNGAVAIYKDVNKQGGINGRKLDLVILDDGCDPQKGKAAVEKLLEKDKVFLLHGGYCSSVALAVMPDIVQLPHVPFVVLGAGAAELSTPIQTNIFQPLPTVRTVGENIVNFSLTKPNTKRVAIIVQPEAEAMSTFAIAIGKLEALKIAPVEIVPMDRGSKDASSQVTAIKRKSPDVVMAMLFPAELAIFLRDAYRLQLGSTIVAVQGLSLDDTSRQVGIRDAMNDLYFFYPLSDHITSPRLSKYAQLMKKYYPADSLDTLSFAGMSGALAIVEALRRLGPNVTRERFIAELNKLENFDPGIQASPISFSPKNHAGVKSGKMISLLRNKPMILDSYPVVLQK